MAGSPPRKTHARPWQSHRSERDRPRARPLAFFPSGVMKSGGQLKIAPERPAQIRSAMLRQREARAPRSMAQQGTRTVGEGLTRPAPTVLRLRLPMEGNRAMSRAFQSRQVANLSSVSRSNSSLNFALEEKMPAFHHGVLWNRMSRLRRAVRIGSRPRAGASSSPRAPMAKARRALRSLSFASSIGGRFLLSSADRETSPMMRRI